MTAPTDYPPLEETQCSLCGEFSGHPSGDYVTDHELIHMEAYWGKLDASSGDPIRLIRSLRAARRRADELAKLLNRPPLEEMG